MAVEFEMASLDGVEEGIRKAYVEKEGKFYLDVERYAEIKAEPLHRKNQELLDEKKKLQQSTKTLEEKAKFGLSDIEKQLQEKDQRIAQLESANREHAIWTPVKTHALKHGVLPDRVDAVMTLLRANSRFDMENERLIFKNDKGHVTDIAPERAFEVYLREEIPWAFEASKAGGSGANNNNRGPVGRVVTRASFDAMSDAARDTLMKEVGEGKARLID